MANDTALADCFTTLAGCTKASGMQTNATAKVEKFMQMEIAMSVIFLMERQMERAFTPGSNGDIYDGEWKQGVKSGNGMWKGINNESYIGEWKDSKCEGYGVHVWANGDRYEGEWKGCLKHGSGRIYYQNGDIYVGGHYNGKMHGKGQYEWGSGGTYVFLAKNMNFYIRIKIISWLILFSPNLVAKSA